MIFEIWLSKRFSLVYLQRFKLWACYELPKNFIYLSLKQFHGRSLEITLWDYDRTDNNQFIGEVLIDLSEALLDNMAHWYPLHLHNYQATPLPTPTPMLSPQNSFDPATIQRYSGGL